MHWRPPKTLATLMATAHGALFAMLTACGTVGCDGVAPTATSLNAPAAQTDTLPTDARKIGVLLVSHGSRSEAWRKMVMDIEPGVRDAVASGGLVAATRSAFMEYSEPSIATRLKEFDREGYTDVILIPLLLTVSSHSFDDIPTIIGRKQDHLTTETLRLEGIEIYKPKAKTHLAPLLDFPAVLEINVARRVKAMSKDPKNEGVVLVAYGAEEYDDQWKELLGKVGDQLKAETGIDRVEHAWCGHVVRYNSEPTASAIREVLKTKRLALVVPVLVAVDEMFQGKIIGGAIERVKQPDRIVYRHDAVLPDENVHRWVIDIARELAAKAAKAPADAAIRP